MKNKSILLALSLCCMMAVSGCNFNNTQSSKSSTSNSTTNVKVTGVSLIEEYCTLDAGTTYQLEATVLPITATNTNVKWSSSDESVATVDQTGLITGYNNGFCIVSATTEDGNYVAECEVTVTGYHLSQNVYTNFSKLENNTYNTSVEGFKNYNISVENENYTEVSFKRGETNEWASLIAWYNRSANPTEFVLEIELVQGELPALLYEFSGDLNFKQFKRVELKKGEIVTHKLNVTDINLKEGDEGAGCWGAVFLELNNPLDSSDTNRGNISEEVILRIHKMGLIEGTKEAPSKLNNLKFNPETERIEFEKDMAASSYELEVYKDDEKLTLDQVPTRFTAIEQIPNMKIGFTPKKDENFAEVEGNYKVRARATNSAGSSEWTDFVDFTIGAVSTEGFRCTGFTSSTMNVGAWNTDKNYQIEQTEEALVVSFVGGANTWDTTNMTFDPNTTATTLRLEFEVLEGNITEIGIEFADWGEGAENEDGKQQNFFQVTEGRNIQVIEITTDLSKGLGQLNFFLNWNGESIGNAKIAFYAIELIGETSEEPSGFRCTGFTSSTMNVGAWNTDKNYQIEQTEEALVVSFVGGANTWDTTNMTFDPNTTATTLRLEFEVLEGNITEIGIEFADWGEGAENEDGKQQNFFQVTEGRNIQVIEITTDLSKGLGQLNFFLNWNGESIGNAKIAFYAIELI